MASVKKIETTVGNVRIETASDSTAIVTLLVGGMDTHEIALNEADLIECVLEYAHERGLRRMRKTPTAKAPKTRKPREPKALRGGAPAPAPEEVTRLAREAFSEANFA